MPIAIAALLAFAGCASAGPGLNAASGGPLVPVGEVFSDVDEPVEHPEKPSLVEAADERAYLGDLYVRAGLLPEAIVEYRRSVEIDPSSAARHFRLGVAYQSIRCFEEALASYREAARLEPASAWAHAAVSIVQAKLGRPSEAMDTYEMVKELDDEMARELLEVLMQYGTFHEV